MVEKHIIDIQRYPYRRCPDDTDDVSCPSKLTFTDGSTEMIKTTEKEYTDILHTIAKNDSIGNPLNTKEIRSVVLSDGITLFRNPPCVHVNVIFSDDTSEKQVWTREKFDKESKPLPVESKLPTQDIIDVDITSDVWSFTYPPKVPINVTYSDGCKKDLLMDAVKLVELYQRLGRKEIPDCLLEYKQ